MDTNILLEQKQKQVEYSKVKYHLYREIVNLTNLNKNQKTLDFELSQIRNIVSYRSQKISSIINFRSRIFNSIDDILQSFLKIKNNRVRNQMHESFNIFTKKYRIDQEYKQINDQLTALTNNYNDVVKNKYLGYNVQMDVRTRTLLEKYNIFRYSMDNNKFSVYNPNAKKNFKITEYRSINHEQLSFIENFKANTDKFIQEINEIEKEIQDCDRDISSENSKIQEIKNELSQLTSKKSSCRDEIETARLDIQIAEINLKLKQIEKEISGNIQSLTDKKNRLRSSICHNKNLAPVSNSDTEPNNKFSEYSQILEQMNSLVQKLNDIENSFPENKNNLNILREKLKNDNLCMKHELECLGIRVSMKYIDIQKNGENLLSFISNDEYNTIFQYSILECTSNIDNLNTSRIDEIIEYFTRFIPFGLEYLEPKINTLKQLSISLHENIRVKKQNYSPTNSNYSPMVLYNQNGCIDYMNINKIASFIDYLIYSNLEYPIIIFRTGEDTIVKLHLKISEFNKYISSNHEKDTKNLMQKIAKSEQNIEQYRSLLVINEELLNEANSRVEYETYKLELKLFEEEN